MNLNFPEKFNLHENSALITGAAGILGRSHAKAILEVGGSVVITDINENALNQAYDYLGSNFNLKNIFKYKLDITNIEELNVFSKELDSRKISINILINNAAINPKVSSDQSHFEFSRLENFSLDQWNAEINVGLTGAFLCSQIFGSKMAKNLQKGVILNISSDLSVISPDQRLYQKAMLDPSNQPVKPVTYSVIKSGLIGLTKYLATYWPGVVRCNALSPGGVYFNQDEAFVKKVSSLIPLGRMAHRNEYESAIQFLCSDASSYLNGQNIIMDGGRSIW
jgi:NAD(P)-dependent dehydrogenase (short-subunit alcohol dehydrogenase family)